MAPEVVQLADTALPYRLRTSLMSAVSSRRFIAGCFFALSKPTPM